MKTFVWDLGQSSVLQQSVFPWLCAAHCNDCICLSIGYETNLPGRASLSRSSTHILTVYYNAQTAIRIKILLHTLACTHAQTWSRYAADAEPMRREAISGYETVSRPAEADCSCRENLLPLSARMIHFP